MQISEALARIKLGERDSDVGICANITRKNIDEGLWYRHKDRAFKCWPKFSGDDRFPVPYKIFGVFPSCPSRAYWAKPLWEGRYGRDRLELLGHLIEYFTTLEALIEAN